MDKEYTVVYSVTIRGYRVVKAHSHSSALNEIQNDLKASVERHEMLAATTLVSTEGDCTEFCQKKVDKGIANGMYYFESGHQD